MPGCRVENGSSGNDHPRQPETWTFSSSGWLFVYFFGVIKALRELGNNKDVYVIGSSGGACAGALLFVDVDIEAMVDYICNCATYARSHWRNALKIREYVRGAVSRFCPEDIAKKVAGHMEISVTKLLTFTNMRLKHFDNKEEYVDAILASSCVVGLAGMPYYTKKHGYLIDGGYSDFQIMKAVMLGTKFCSFHNGDVTSVCPFYCSRADVKPSRYVPVYWALYPPEASKLRDIYKLGIHDTLMFLRKKGKLRMSSTVNLLWQYSLGKPIEERLTQIRTEQSSNAAALHLHHHSAPQALDSPRSRRSASVPCTSLGLDGANGISGVTPTVVGLSEDNCSLGNVGCSASQQDAGMRPQEAASSCELDGDGVDDDIELEEIEARWQAKLVEGMDILAKHAHRRLESEPRGGLWGLVHLWSRSCAWSMVYLELLVQTHICTCMITVTPLLLLVMPGADWAQAWNRLCFCWSSMFNFRLLLKTLPLLGSGVRMQGNSMFEIELAKISFMYRFLYYML